MKEKRVFELSAMNIALCLLVIFIHVSSEPVTSYQISSMPYAVVCIAQRGASFVVQGFLFLGGLKLMKRRDPMPYPAFLRDRFVRILLPYALWTVLYYVFFVHVGWMRASMGDLLRYLCTGTVASPFYFVIIITQFYLLAPLWKYLADRWQPASLCLAGLALMLLSKRYLPAIMGEMGIRFAYYDRIFPNYLFYWLAGCAVGKHYDAFHSWVCAHGKYIVLLFAATFGGAVLPYYWHCVHGGGGIWLDGVHVFYCIAAILLLYRICCALPAPRGKAAAFWETLDHATYHIYLTHCLLLQEVNIRMSAIGLTSITVRYGIRIVVVYVVTIALCMAYQWGKRHIQV